MARKDLITLAVVGLAAFVAYQYYVESTADDDSDSETDPTDSAVNQGITGPLQNLWESIVTTIIPGSWMSQGEGPMYMPTFNAVESQYGIPTNLLARLGYQESHFRADIISGAVTSSAGAIGIMQLLPQYFPNAGQNPQGDIQTAGQYLAQLYNQFGDWQVAIGAYNDGPGNMTAILNGTKAMPLETQNYIADVVADVPVQGSLIQVA